MGGFAVTDFSGGMVSDISELLSPENTVKTLQNGNIWDELGSVKLLTGFTSQHQFPTNKVYSHHVIFPVQGTGDYAIIMMSDGTVYSYTAAAGFSLLTTVTAGSRMAYAGDSIYIFYRSMTAPSIANTVRKVIKYDYSGSAFTVSDIIIKEYFTVGSVTEIAHGYSGTVEEYFAKVTYVDVREDGSESKGVEVSKQNDSEYQYAVKVTKTTGFNALRCYVSIKDLLEEVFITPGFAFEIKDEPSYVPITDGNIFGNTGTAAATEIHVVKTNGTGVSDVSFMSWILDQYDSGTKYIDVGHKIKIFGIEYTISTITKDTSTPPLVKYIITLGASVPAFIMGLTEYLTTSTGGQYAIMDVQLDFVSDVIYLPIMRRFREIAGIPIDENRPETDFTSGTGNLLAFVSNKLFTANPYYPDYFGSGDDEDKKGFISWNWITGEGRHAFGLIPNTQLLGLTFTGSTTIDLFGFQETLFILTKSGIARLEYKDNKLNFLQSDKFGVDSIGRYYADSGNIFIYSDGRLWAGAVDKLNYEAGAFDFVELGRSISSLLSALTSPKIVYDNKNDLLYVSDTSNGVCYICCLRDKKPAWVKLSTGGVNFHSGFKLAGQFYFIQDVAGTYFVTKYDAAPYGNSFILEDKDRYLPMEHSYVRKVEVLYQKTSGTLTCEVYLDGSSVFSQALPNKTEPGFYEFRLSRSSKTRFDKIRIKLTGSSLSSDTKILGYFVNRDEYGQEMRRGY